MTHFYCKGTCGGVSDKSGACMSKTCELRGKPLTECKGKGCSHKMK